MWKKIVLAVVLLVPSLACAQPIQPSGSVYEEDTAGASGDPLTAIACRRNDTPTSRVGTDGDYSAVACDEYGRLSSTTSLTWSGSTTDPSKLEDAAHVTGDRGMAMLGVADDNTPSPTSGTAGDYVLPAISSFTGALQVSVVQAFQSSAGAGLLNLEDAVHSSGDTGVPSLAVRQDTLASSNADNDYGNLKLDGVGALWVRQRDTVAEDAQLTDGLITPAIGIKRTDTAAASANAADDNMYATGDGRGLMYVNPWGANHTEWFRACSASDVTGTAATEIQAATASKYTYLTAANCTNTDATVNTRVNIVQETAVATEILWSFNLAAVVGSDGMQFNPPLKATAVNKNIGVVPITTSAEVRCCVEGFVSAN